MTYQQHPLSALFPPMAEAEYLKLLDSITNIGVQNPITLYEGMVLDGWNRYRAATEVGQECPARSLEEWIEPREFVDAQNNARRHLTDSQRAFVAAKLANLSNGQKSSSANLQSTAVSQADAAETLKVSVRSVADGAKVLRDGDKELADAVERGEVSVSAAAKVAELPKEEQREIVQQGKVKDVARAARAHGKPKKGPKADVIRAELKAAGAQHEKQAALSQVEALKQEIAGLRDALAASQDELTLLQACVEQAEEPLKAAIDEARKQRELARGLQTRIDGLMNDLAQAKRDAAHWKRKAEAAA